MSNPVSGSASAEMSLTRRCEPHTELFQTLKAVCHNRAGITVLHPPPVARDSTKPKTSLMPLSSHAHSDWPRVVWPRYTDVPPTATTVLNDAGADGWLIDA